MTAPAIPPRFLAGSTEPAVAYTVAELRELLAELPGWVRIDGGAMLAVDQPQIGNGILRIEQVPIDDPDDGSEATFALAQLLINDLAEPLADPDGDFDPDGVELKHETGGES